MTGGGRRRRIVRGFNLKREPNLIEVGNNLKLKAVAIKQRKRVGSDCVDPAVQINRQVILGDSRQKLMLARYSNETDSEVIVKIELRTIRHIPSIILHCSMIKISIILQSEERVHRHCTKIL